MLILAVAVFSLHAISWYAPATDYATSPFSKGIVSGYLTMDIMGGMAFGVVIVNAIRSRGIDSMQEIARYSVRAGLIAGVALTCVYTSLFILGLKSAGFTFSWRVR